MGVTFDLTKKQTKVKGTQKAQSNVKTEVVLDGTDLDGERTEKVLEESHTPVDLPEREFTQPTANVGFSCKMTKNLGDFNSLSVTVSVHLPCYTHEIQPTYGHAKKFVEDKLNETLAEYEDVTADDFE